jgi:D-beta-D-heptose 7-phosphate kinase/D-beta-D-heptose 1-phosphate adenosyltransferase
MSTNRLSVRRVQQILSNASKVRILVVGDIMLDHFIWGTVSRISPEAPVPVVEFRRENLMPGGAANVARNLTSLNICADLFGRVGKDAEGEKLRRLMVDYGIRCTGLLTKADHPTSVKIRIIAHQQQVVRIDREARDGLDAGATRRVLAAITRAAGSSAGIIVGDYGKGVVTQPLLDGIKALCRERGLWLSLDPKPVHKLNLAGLSLLTPNRKEAFELAGLTDETRNADPLADKNLMHVASRLLADLRPALLLITLGESGMLLCQSDRKPFHIPTVAQEVFDVSGAGDTVIATFTLAVAAGASPVEAAILSNHAAGIVVGKFGTATVSPEELLASFAK